MMVGSQHAAGRGQVHAAPYKLAGQLLAIAAPLRGLGVADMLGGEGVESAAHEALWRGWGWGILTSRSSIHLRYWADMASMKSST
jgi:hypothetical protein